MKTSFTSFGRLNQIKGIYTRQSICVIIGMLCIGDRVVMVFDYRPKSWHNWHISQVLSFPYTYICISRFSSVKTGAKCRTDYPFGASEFTHGFYWVPVARSWVFSVLFCRPLFVPLTLLVFVLSILLRFTASYYPFGIFNLSFLLDIGWKWR